MNFVLPSLGNTTENLNMSDKFAYKKDEADAGTTALAVLVSFTAMVVGAGIMVCFVGKLLSKWYAVDTSFQNSTFTSSKPKYSEVDSQEATESAASGFSEPQFCKDKRSMKMKPIGSGFCRGILRTNMHKYFIKHHLGLLIRSIIFLQIIKE